MDNQLQEYVKYCESFYDDSFMVTLDLELNVVFVGKQYLKVINKSRKEVVGKPMYEITPIPEHNRALSKITFPQAIKNKQTKQIFIANLYHPYPESHILMLLFSPIINFQKEVIAARLDFTPVEISYFFQILIQVNYKITPSNLPNNEDYLTAREHQVAFLLCHCQDTIDIARIISLFLEKNIVSKTVHNIINRYLFPKFNVKGKSDLIEKLKQEGYDKKIPNSLLSNQFIDLTKLERAN
jgi:hypothetical protein